MREIKFRAWNSKNQLMIQFEDIFFGELNFRKAIVLLKALDQTLMQFTGLKDKNGIEIYEGDIARCLYAGGNGNIYLGSVTFSSGGAFELAGAPLWTWESIEVIGNIYENKDLV